MTRPQRPLPSEGRGQHGFDPFIAIYHSSKSGTSGERGENRHGLHRSCTGALVLNERGAVKAYCRSINSRVLFVYFQCTLSHIHALGPHGILRATAFCHNAANRENSYCAVAILASRRPAARSRCQTRIQGYVIGSPVRNFSCC